LQQLTLFAADFPVSRIPLLADVKGLQTIGTCGPTLSASFAVLDPAGWWRKTSQGYCQMMLDGSLAEYSRDLAQSGYAAEWDCLPASAFGAHHQRDRVWIVADTHRTGCGEQRRIFTVRPELFAPECSGGWRIEPDVGRVAHGVPARVDRLRGLGNAIVPQIAEWIARRIRTYEVGA